MIKKGIKGENDDEDMSQFLKFKMNYRRCVTLCLAVVLALAAGTEDDSAAEAGTGTGAVVAGGRCSATAAQLTVTTSHNATGHWLAALRLERRTRLPSRPAVVVLDVRPSATRCAGVRHDTLLVTLQGPPPPAGPGYVELQGFGYYKVHEELVSWEDAKGACEAEDAHLLVLNSEAEAQAVGQLLRRFPNIAAWASVGFRDVTKEGKYMTIFGETLEAAGYARWQQNQPDSRGKENCGSVYVSTMGLNDLHCTTFKAPFVCEQIVG